MNKNLWRPIDVGDREFTCPSTAVDNAHTIEISRFQDFKGLRNDVCPQSSLGDGSRKWEW